MQCICFNKERGVVESGLLELYLFVLLSIKFIFCLLTSILFVWAQLFKANDIVS